MHIDGGSGIANGIWTGPPIRITAVSEPGDSGCPWLAGTFMELRNDAGVLHCLLDENGTIPSLAIGTGDTQPSGPLLIPAGAGIFCTPDSSMTPRWHPIYKTGAGGRLRANQIQWISSLNQSGQALVQAPDNPESNLLWTNGRTWDLATDNLLPDNFTTQWSDGSLQLLDISQSGTILANAVSAVDGSIHTIILVQTGFEVPGTDYDNGANPAAKGVPVNYFPVSNPRPTIELSDDPTVTINESVGTITVSIPSGTVHDLISDNFPDDTAEIPNIGVYSAAGDVAEATTYATTALSRQSDGDSSRWRPYPKKFAFAAMTAAIPLQEGAQSIQIQTDANLAGNAGSKEIIVHSWQETQPMSGTNTDGSTIQTSLTIAFIGTHSTTTPNSITLTDQSTSPPLTVTLTEADDQPGSNIFAGTLGDADVVVSITTAPDPTVSPQVLTAEVGYSSATGAIAIATLVFNETVSGSNAFDGTIPWTTNGDEQTLWYASFDVKDTAPSGAHIPIQLGASGLPPGLFDGGAIRFHNGTIGDLPFDPITLPLGVNDSGQTQLNTANGGAVLLVKEQNDDGTWQYKFKGLGSGGTLIDAPVGNDAAGFAMDVHFNGTGITAGTGTTQLTEVGIAMAQINVYHTQLFTLAGTGSTKTRIVPADKTATVKNNYNLGNMAWIDSTNFGDDSPVMPHLIASFGCDDPTVARRSDIDVRWRLEVKYDRPYDGIKQSYNIGTAEEPHILNHPKLAMDRVVIPGDRFLLTDPPITKGGGISKWLNDFDGHKPDSETPAPGWTSTMPANDDWDIMAESQWQVEVYQGFFGGDAHLFCQTRTVPNGAWTDAGIFKFRIGGKNPDDSVCQAYIKANWTDSSGFTHWYADGVARHETKGENTPNSLRDSPQHNGTGSDVTVNPNNIYNASSANPLGVYYNHFAEGVGRPINYWAAGFLNHYNDKAKDILNALGKGDEDDPLPDTIVDGTGGFGVFQITRNEGDSDFAIPRKIIWNWQANVIAGIDELRVEREVFADQIDLTSKTVPSGTVYVTHAVPRTATQDRPGTASTAARTQFDAMNAATNGGKIPGGDGTDGGLPPNCFPSGSTYRRATFNDRSGYLILDTIRRFNGGSYMKLDKKGQWVFRRWPSSSDPKSYVDAVFFEMDAADVRAPYSP